MAVITRFAVREDGRVVGDAAAVVVVFERDFDCLFREDGAVELVFRQTVEGFRDRTVGQVHGVFEGLAFDHFRSH